MSEAKAKKIADAADMIVNGYAMLKHRHGVQIVNLFSGHVTLASPEFEILATSMDDIEAAIAVQRLKDNFEFLAA